MRHALSNLADLIKISLKMSWSMLGELLSVLRRFSDLRANFLKLSQKSHFQLYWPCINTFVHCGLFEFPQPFPGINWPFSLDIIVGMAKWAQTIKITKINEEILSGTMSQSYNDLWQMCLNAVFFIVLSFYWIQLVQVSTLKCLISF